MDSIIITGAALCFGAFTAIYFRKNILKHALSENKIPVSKAGRFDAIFGLLSQDEDSAKNTDTSEDKTQPESNDKEYVLEDKLEAKELVDHLLETDYKETDFTDLEIDILENTKILCNYDDWAYKDVYSLKDSKLLVFFPKVVIPQDIRITHYTQYRLMLWKKIDNYAGRYFFWDKNSGKNFYDRIRTNDDIKLNNYNSLTLQQGGDCDVIKNIMDKFDNEPNLEIEIEDDDLFIKVSQSPNLEDFLRIEKILNSL